MTLSITVDDELGRDLDAMVAGGNRSAMVAQAIREYLDRRRITAASAWHASLTGDDAAALAEFDATWWVGVTSSNTPRAVDGSECWSSVAPHSAGATR